MGITSQFRRQAAQLTIALWLSSGALLMLPMYFDRTSPTLNDWLMTLVIVVIGAVLSGGLFVAVVATRDRGVTARMAAAMLVVIASSAVLAIAVAAIIAVMDPAFAQNKPYLMRVIYNFGFFSWQFALLGALYSVLQANERARDRERQLAAARQAAVEANAAATSARLAALRYQLNPHFLFNTLNALSSLVVTRRNDDAEAMLSRLSDFLRATLAGDPEGPTTLEDELATLQTYLEVESIRFGDRLAVEFDCPLSLRDALVPGFILQPLVENAVKYAVAPTTRPVTIRVEARQQGEQLVVAVEDDGDPLLVSNLAHMSTGVGLANVRQRLEVLFGKAALLETVVRERGFIATIRLPLQFGHDEVREAAE
ncbi:sensor histidine kinase [Sphingomonas sp. LaA6.9]|uniref:sensor histidine kinase n=1 Tax=Sphingomonas sp. LaA6.9 TaxID=2919914 RepID=UPI001F4FFF02|nr:histidine kinase [Sphingomonas sp. LaA6.9]MCJ8159294.1 histidine kinase [Sphingomonas sp. LaA6.9]